MITARRQRFGSRRVEGFIKAGDHRQAFADVDGVHRAVSKICYPVRGVGRGLGDVMERANEHTHRAHLARAVAGAGSVRGAAVIGQTDQRNIGFSRIGQRGQAKKADRASVAGRCR
jgi:hypothetical protein